MTKLQFQSTLLTRPESAEYLGVQPQTLAKWAMLGEGPRYAKVGRAVRYRLSDLDDWIESRTVRRDE